MFYSDLIDEMNCGEIEKNNLLSNKCTFNKKLKYSSYCVKYSVLSKKDVETFAKPKGNYFLLNKININTMNYNKIDYYSTILANCFVDMVGDYDELKILIVGLGNEDIQCDSLGVKVCDKLAGIREHVENVFIYETNVFGKTGIESFEIVEAIVKKKNINLVVVVDSLCAAAKERLNSSIQVTNAGITPGSGVYNTRKSINKKNLKCEVLAVGVPLMIYSDSFFISALRKAGIEFDTIKNKQNDEVYSKLLQIFNDREFDLIVASSNIREVIDIFSDIIFNGLYKFLLKRA